MKTQSKYILFGGLTLCILMTIETWFLRTVMNEVSVLTAGIITVIIPTVFFFGLAIFMHRTVTVPLKKLREGAGEFSRGNLDYRLNVQGTDEISLVAAQMNGMADSLKSSRGELEARLSESANELAAAGRAGTSIRHEINNPLTTVIGNLELLIERYQHKDKDLTARLEVVLTNALRIADLTKQMRDFKKETSPDHLTGVNSRDVPSR